jgi:hypothetical protein
MADELLPIQIAESREWVEILRRGLNWGRFGYGPYLLDQQSDLGK